MRNACVFCKVARGQIPSHCVHEDVDIGQVNPGHVDRHRQVARETIVDLTADEAAAAFRTVTRVPRAVDPVFEPGAPPTGARDGMAASTRCAPGGKDVTAARSRYGVRRFPAALTCLPLVGTVDGSPFAHGPVVEDADPVIGRSVSPTPAVVKIVVGEEAGPPANVGSLVKRKFFADRPGFLVNVCFSRGPGRSYCDPHSIWFNVFAGYYEIDVPRRSWGRPFGYTTGPGGAPAIDFDDVVRIGKADWNYFSNYVYGVPARHIEPFDAVDLGSARCAHLGREAIGGRDEAGGRHWDVVEVDHVAVVSAYLSDRDGEALESPSPLLSPLWRLALGRPRPRPTHPRSFIPTDMRARVYMSYSECHHSALGEAYRTHIFGGTVNTAYHDAGKNERFFDLQMRALRRVIGEHYPDLGFERP